jgi:hypothetical protein
VEPSPQTNASFGEPLYAKAGNTKRDRAIGRVAESQRFSETAGKHVPGKMEKIKTGLNI